MNKEQNAYEQLVEFGECVVDAYEYVGRVNGKLVFKGIGVANARAQCYAAGKLLGVGVRTHIVRHGTFGRTGFIRGHLASKSDDCPFCCIQYHYGLCD